MRCFSVRNTSFGFLLSLALAACADANHNAQAQDVSSIAGPPTAADYTQAGPVKTRFSSYRERNFPGDTTPGAARLLNVPQAKSYTEKLAQIDADEGFVSVPAKQSRSM